MKPDFTLEGLFKLFEFEETGFIYINDILQIWSELKVEADDFAVQLFIQKYDKDRDGRLSFYEFWDAFSPIRKEYAIMLWDRDWLNKQTIQQKGIKAFSQETRYQIMEMLDCHIQNELKNEELWASMKLHPYFDSSWGFKSIDLNRVLKWQAFYHWLRWWWKKSEQKITRKDVRLIFQEYGFWLTTQEIFLLMSRFHIE